MWKRFCLLTVIGLLICGASSLKEPEREVRTIRLLISDRGYRPFEVQLSMGHPVRLEIQNLSNSPQNFVAPSLNIYSFTLDKGEKIEIRLKPEQRGSFEFFSDLNQSAKTQFRGHIRIQ